MVATSHFFMYNGFTGFATEALSTIAVEIFFVLSGFVLAPQIVLILNGQMRHGLATFLVRRWMRTVPPYLLVLLLISTLLHKCGSKEFLLYASYLQNLVSSGWMSVDYYPVAWSLSVEEWFYLTFPVFLMVTMPRHPVSTRCLAYAAVGFIIIIFVLRLAFGDPLSWGKDVRRVVIFRIDSIAFGFLLAVTLGSRVKRTFAPLLCGAMVASAVGLSGILRHTESDALFQTLYPLCAAVFGAVSICFFLSIEQAFQRRFMSVIADAAGKMSYALYLFHLLPIYVLGSIGGTWPLGVRFLAFAVSTLLVAAASTYLIEQPILEARPKFRARVAKVLDQPERQLQGG